MARPPGTRGKGVSRGGGGRGGGDRDRSGGRGRGSGRAPGGRGEGRRRDDKPNWEHMALPLPGKTAERLGRRPGRDDNVGLWLDKFVYRKLRDAAEPGRSSADDDWSLTAAARNFALSQFCTARTAASGAQALARRREALCADDAPALEFEATVNGRLLVDYGRANAVETTISFHPVWGVPRIPGSALKGLCRAALERGQFAEEEQDIQEADLVAILGDERAAGQVVFHDALPADGAFELALDVLTPHHGSYYGSEGKDPPGDWESPKPHTFLTVVNTTFVFHLSVCPYGEARASTKENEAGKRWLGLACSGMRSALEWDGVGAKTSAGYGHFIAISEGKWLA